MNNPTFDQPILVMITVPSAEVGRDIAAALIEMRLAACVSIAAPVSSLYRWQGRIHDDHEALLLVKSRSLLFVDRLIPAVREVHPYETPEIIALPIVAGDADYLNWIAAETQPGG